MALGLAPTAQAASTYWALERRLSLAAPLGIDERPASLTVASNKHDRPTTRYNAQDASTPIKDLGNACSPPALQICTQYHLGELNQRAWVAKFVAWPLSCSMVVERLRSRGSPCRSQVSRHWNALQCAGLNTKAPLTRDGGDKSVYVAGAFPRFTQ